MSECLPLGLQRLPERITEIHQQEEIKQQEGAFHDSAGSRCRDGILRKKKKHGKQGQARVNAAMQHTTGTEGTIYQNCPSEVAESVIKRKMLQ